MGGGGGGQAIHKHKGHDTVIVRQCYFQEFAHLHVIGQTM